jgi:hypothetical protein
MRPSTIGTAARQAAGSVVEAALIVAVIAALLFAVGVVSGHPAGAAGTLAKGGGNYTITVVAPSGAARTRVAFGATVTTYSTYGAADPLFARMWCTANSSTVTGLAVGAKVFDVYKSIREGDWNTGGYATFDSASSPVWTGGSADCHADLRTYTMHNADRIWKTLASDDFTVGG